MMRRLCFPLAATLASAGLVTIPQTAIAADTNRVGSDSASTTSVDLFLDRTDLFDGQTVVLTRLDNHADGLAATPLASALKAPVLLTESTRLDPAVVEAVRQRKVKRVVIVGGPQAVPASAEQALGAAGAQVSRIAGASRTETATAVAAEVRRLTGATSTPVFVATGLVFPDAVAAGAAAAKVGGVVVLSTGTTVDASTRAYLRSNATSQVYAVGGAAATAVRTAAIPATALVGADRYETAAKVAQQAFPKPTEAVLTDGLTFGHSVVGSALAARLGSPLLLTNPSTLPKATENYIRTPGMRRVTALGGKQRIADSVLTTVTTVTGKPASPPPAPAGMSAAQWEQRVVDLLTAERVKHGLRPLTKVSCLSRTAKTRSETMLRTGRYENIKDWRPLGACDPDHIHQGEVIDRGDAQRILTPEANVKKWMADPSRREVILHPQNLDVGVGFAGSLRGQHYATVHFLG